MKLNKAVLSMLLAASHPAAAYEPATHALMSSEAVAMTSFGREARASALFTTLGFGPPALLSSREYIDLGLGTIMRNRNRAQEKMIGDLFSDSGMQVPGAYEIPGWVAQGAIREDDDTLIHDDEGQPPDEPGGVFNRVYGHF